MKALDGFEMKRVTFLSEKRTIRIRSKQTLKPVYVVGLLKFSGMLVNRLQPSQTFEVLF